MLGQILDSSVHRQKNPNFAVLQVQDKSIELQRAIAMNRQISVSYDNLQNQFDNMEKRDNAIIYATIELLSHISQNIGSQLDSSALATFLRQIVPFLPSNKVSQMFSKPFVKLLLHTVISLHLLGREALVNVTKIYVSDFSYCRLFFWKSFQVAI